MGKYRLKSREDNFLAIASGQRRIDPRLADIAFEAGDKVTFARYDPAIKAEGAEVAAIVTHVARFAPELFKPLSDEALNGEYVVLGLSRPTDSVVAPPGAIALKAWPAILETITQGSRVDLRRRDRPFKYGGALVYQEFSPENNSYGSGVAIRQIRRITPWKPTDFYTVEQLREHGVAVLGWKGLEAKVA